MRVLVINDDDDTTASFRLLLQALGHVVATANDGPAALELAAACLPDVALINLGIPRLGGYEVARRLKALPGLEKVTVVAMTGLPGRTEPNGAVDRYLLKPVAPDDLCNLLKSLADN